MVGADETRENINGELRWMWAWQTQNCAIFIATNHGENGL